MTTLLSRNNPRIKQAHLLLKQRKERADSGLFVVEGIHHVGEACAAHAAIEYLIYAPDLLTSDFALQLIKEQDGLGVTCLPVGSDTFTHMASKENPQGILAVVRQPHIELNQLSATSYSLGVALVAPQDPGNIGSILRTIDAVGASGLILLDDPENNQYSADPYHPSAVRASMGAIFWYPVVSAMFADFAGWAKDMGYVIIGTSAHASQDYRTIERIDSSLIVLMGSEREGLTAAQSAICDRIVRIPMQGRVSSLNLATATSVILYELIRGLI